MNDEPDPPAERVLEVLGRLSHSLQALHAAYVYHRDLKPENVIVRGDGTPVLVDFGLAHVDIAGVLPSETAGTLEYMAPEQARGETIDGRADLYALGVIAFEWLVGFRPLQLQDRSPEAWPRILEEKVPARVSEFRPDVDAATDDLVASLLAKEPDDRPPDAAAVAEACNQGGAKR
jgi:serine/threonine protein kinase